MIRQFRSTFKDLIASLLSAATEFDLEVLLPLDHKQAHPMQNGQEGSPERGIIQLDCQADLFRKPKWSQGGESQKLTYTPLEVNEKELIMKAPPDEEGTDSPMRMEYPTEPNSE